MPTMGSSYSQIINSVDYNHIMSNQHLYISAADQFILQMIKELVTPSAEVVELGCGPARVLALVSKIEGINCTGIDLDNQFLNYARVLVEKPHVKIIAADAEHYKHHKEVDVFYSQGFHHHVPKGSQTTTYLQNVYNNLKVGGYYILSDEFIPEYNTLKERELKIVIWYSHVISHAIKKNYLFLAQEEAKTLLDDLFEGRTNKNIKSQEQISFVLSKVEPIDQASRQSNSSIAHQLAEEFITELESYHNLKLHGDITVDLSRGDYKISDHVLREEIKQTNFSIDSVQFFGLSETIGGMSVYILKKDSAL